MKLTRQTMILDIINKVDISTQEELAEELKKRNVVATQATISRDIKELHLIKTQDANGTYKYSFIDRNDDSMEERWMRLFSESVLSITSANNLIVMHTVNGTASAAAGAIDKLRWDDILGTIAGDDTILVIVSSNEAVPPTMAKFRQMMR
ncbi:MAG: arginine repressor [Clostridia bacterium]|nr:arginine repressor [Clostridia bacterium]